MSQIDPIADLLSRVRNAHLAKHDRLDLPTSKLKVEVCRLLKEEGLIKNFRLVDGEPRNVLRIFLRYTYGASVDLVGASTGAPTTFDRS